MCAKTLVSPHLSAWAPTVVCVGKESIIEYLNIINTILEQYMCICVFMFTFEFIVHLLCLLQFIMKHA